LNKNILATDKITKIFCITNDFRKKFSKEMEKVPPIARTRQTPSDNEPIAGLPIAPFSNATPGAFSYPKLR
jgi:hypothetical protein